jgi:DoxX-like protein
VDHRGRPGGVGLLIVMLGAIVTHGRRREVPHAAFNVVPAALALVVAAGRF